MPPLGSLLVDGCGYRAVVLTCCRVEHVSCRRRRDYENGAAVKIRGAGVASHWHHDETPGGTVTRSRIERVSCAHPRRRDHDDGGAAAIRSVVDWLRHDETSGAAVTCSCLVERVSHAHRHCRDHDDGAAAATRSAGVASRRGIETHGAATRAVQCVVIAILDGVRRVKLNGLAGRRLVDDSAGERWSHRRHDPGRIAYRACAGPWFAASCGTTTNPNPPRTG